MMELEVIKEFLPKLSLIAFFFLLTIRGVSRLVLNGEKVNTCISMWIRRDRRRNNGKLPEGVPDSRRKSDKGGMPFYLPPKYYNLIYAIFILIIVITIGFPRNPFQE